MKDLANISVEVTASYPYDKRASASWESEGARFHVWFDVATKEIHREYGTGKLIIYKNPPLRIERNSPEHFNTRYLDGDKPCNAALLRQVFDVIERNSLIAKGIAVAEEKQRQRDAENLEVARQNRMMEAGPRLYALVKRWRDNEGKDGCCLPVTSSCSCKKCQTKALVREIEGD